MRESSIAARRRRARWPSPAARAAAARWPTPIDVALLHVTVVPADDVRKLVADVIVVAALGVLVPVAFIKITRRLAVVAVRAVNRDPIKRVADQGRVLPRLVLKRRVNAFRINVIVVAAHGIGMAAA